MTETRKHLTAKQKMTALRRHLLEHVPVSDVCDAYGINPTGSSRSFSAYVG
jgi:transposase